MRLKYIKCLGRRRAVAQFVTQALLSLNWNDPIFQIRKLRHRKVTILPNITLPISDGAGSRTQVS